jgi:hypothetical protein
MVECGVLSGVSPHLFGVYMSRKIDHFIAELVSEDMLDIKKFKKAELFPLVQTLLHDNYRELHNDTIVEMYEEKFHTFVRSSN